MDPCGTPHSEDEGQFHLWTMIVLLFSAILCKVTEHELLVFIWLSVKIKALRIIFQKKHLNTVLCGKVQTESRFALKTADVKFF